MSREEKWGKPARRKDGHVGAKVKVSVRGEGGCDGHYAIETYGLSSTQVAAEVDRIHSFHDDRAGRMDGFRAIQARPITIGDETYRVVDLAIRPAANAAHCTLYIDVRNVTNGSERVAGFPMRILYKTPAEIPNDAAIVAMVTAAIPVETEDLALLHRDFVDRVGAKLQVLHEKNKREFGVK